MLSALNTIPALNGNVLVSGNNGGPFTIVYSNAFANQSVAPLTVQTVGGVTARVTLNPTTPLATSEVQTLTFATNINGADPKLLPDLSAAVDVELERQPNALVAPRDAIFAENGHAYVRVKNGSDYEKRGGKLGPRNSVEQVVLSGIGKGAVLMRNANS